MTTKGRADMNRAQAAPEELPTAAAGSAAGYRTAASVGYRIVNYWLPLIPGTVAHIRLRLRQAAHGKTKPETAKSDRPVT